MKKALPIILIVAGLAAVFVKFSFLPQIGNPDDPAHVRTSDYYIEHSVKDTNSPNYVTAVIVDYRAFDTMLETTVMFLAGLGVVVLLASKPDASARIIRPRRYIERRVHLGTPAYQSVNKDVMIKVLEPVILIYAVYVLFHSEVSLGGGFQAGALIGMVYILDTMVSPSTVSLIKLPKERSVALAGAGTFIYTFTGILTLAGGGIFLEYGKLPFPMSFAEKHSTGILLVEIGVTIGVMATIITILNGIMERVRFDDDI